MKPIEMLLQLDEAGEPRRDDYGIQFMHQPLPMSEVNQDFYLRHGYRRVSLIDPQTHVAVERSIVEDLLRNYTSGAARYIDWETVRAVRQALAQTTEEK